MMKILCILLTLAPALAVRADLVLEQEFANTNVTGHMTLKVHDDKMRMDEDDTSSNAYSVIIDLKTRDSYTLMPKTKTYRRRLGKVIAELIQSRKPTDPINQVPAAPLDTGRTELMNGMGTRIFSWSGAEGRSQTLWVATNFPNFDTIRKDLAKLDEFDQSGPHRNAQPELSLLPGMVVKSVVINERKTETKITLVSAKVEPLSASLFELPADYTPWQPRERSTTNSIAPK